jgi:hypothetical protein
MAVAEAKLLVPTAVSQPLLEALHLAVIPTTLALAGESNTL